MRPDTLMMSEPMNLISAAVAGAIKAMLIPIAAKNLFTVISARIINPRRQFLSIVGSPRRARRRTTRRAGGSAGRPPLFGRDASAGDSRRLFAGGLDPLDHVGAVNIYVQ